MAIQTNRFYNDPNIGAAFTNIASMFAPPGAGDMANYSLARQRNQQADIIAQLQNDPAYQGADMGILAGLYNWDGSHKSMMMDDATARRGQDVSAQTSVTNNILDNQTSLALPRFSPLAPGEMLPPVAPSLAEQFGLPGDLGAVQGNPKPLSETEQKALERQELIKLGLVDNNDLVDTILSDIPVENVVGEGGAPVVTRRSDAVGQEPFIQKGAEAKPENAVAQLSDGTQVPAIQGEDGVWHHAQTGEALPPDIQIYKVPAPTGSNADVGLGKPTANFIDRSLIDIAVAKNTAVTLRDLIAKAPASQGMVGFLRGTAQNLVQTGGELGTFFGGGMAEVAAAIEEGTADAGLAGAFDPNIPAIEMMANLLAFQYAKTTTGERLSNEMLRAAKSALGLDGLDANQANSTARLDQAIQMISQQEEILKRAKNSGVDALSAPAETDDLPTPQTQEDFDALQPGDHYIDPDDGAEYVK